MKIDLSGRVALIPGGSGGIGSAIAEALAAAGADVAIGFHKNEKRAEEVARTARASGRRAIVSRTDLTRYEAAKEWVDQAAAELGRVDILATCVGAEGTFQLFREQTPEQWERLVLHHLMAGVYLSRCVMDQMIAQRWGRIITLGSDGAKVGQSGAAVGNAGNAGLIAFNKSLAREVARYGITVNAVCPGPTRTPTLDELRASGDTGAKMADAALRAIPMKRAGEPAEVAAMFVFLASEAAGYITGQAISVSGGLTMC